MILNHSFGNRKKRADDYFLFAPNQVNLDLVDVKETQRMDRGPQMFSSSNSSSAANILE